MGSQRIGHNLATTTDSDIINSALHIHIYSRFPLCWLMTAISLPGSYHLLQLGKPKCLTSFPKRSPVPCVFFQMHQGFMRRQSMVKTKWNEVQPRHQELLDCTNCGFSFPRELQTMPGSLSVRDTCESCPEQGVETDDL